MHYTVMAEYMQTFFIVVKHAVQCVTAVRTAGDVMCKQGAANPSCVSIENLFTCIQSNAACR